MYLLVSPCPKLLEHEDLEPFENRMYFKYTQTWTIAYHF